jgi:hypothetical protein
MHQSRRNVDKLPNRSCTRTRPRAVPGPSNEYENDDEHVDDTKYQA